MIQIDHVTFSYGGENESAGGIQDINLNIEDGQFVVLCGESGCGKTTITRLINGLIPHYYEGKMNGEVWVNGAKVSEQPLYDTAKTVGSVFQNPRSQFLMWIQPAKLHSVVKISASRNKVFGTGWKKPSRISVWRN